MRSYSVYHNALNGICFTAVMSSVRLFRKSNVILLFNVELKMDKNKKKREKEIPNTQKSGFYEQDADKFL